MKIGYGRVSTRDQNPDAQRDALAAAGSLHGLIELAEMTGRSGRTGKTDLN